MKKICKCSAIIIKDKKILLTKKYGTNTYISPGGKLYSGESHFECLERELLEEVSLRLIDISFFGEFLDTAAFESSTQIQSFVYFCEVNGVTKENSEIEKADFFSIDDLNTIKVGSTFSKFVIPQLKNEGLLE